MTTKEELEKLKASLPWGYGAKLAAITGKSKSAVYKALSGEIDSPEIVQAAIELANEHKSKKKLLSNGISKL